MFGLHRGPLSNLWKVTVKHIINTQHCTETKQRAEPFSVFLRYGHWEQWEQWQNWKQPKFFCRHWCWLFFVWHCCSSLQDRCHVLSGSLSYCCVYWILSSTTLTGTRELVGVFLFSLLRFYGLVNPLGSCRVRSVYLTTPFPGQA